MKKSKDSDKSKTPTKFRGTVTVASPVIEPVVRKYSYSGEGDVKEHPDVMKWDHDEQKYIRRYSGPGRSGVCMCGCLWDQHHLMLKMNEKHVKETQEAYVVGECTHYGFNRSAGMKYDEEQGAWNEHCLGYRDSEAEAAKIIS